MRLAEIIDHSIIRIHFIFRTDRSSTTSTGTSVISTTSWIIIVIITSWIISWLRSRCRSTVTVWGIASMFIGSIGESIWPCTFFGFLTRNNIKKENYDIYFSNFASKKGGMEVFEFLPKLYLIRNFYNLAYLEPRTITKTSPI